MIVITDSARESMRETLREAFREGKLREIKEIGHIRYMSNDELFNFFIIVVSRLLKNK